MILIDSFWEALIRFISLHMNPNTIWPWARTLSFSLKPYSHLTLPNWTPQLLVESTVWKVNCLVAWRGGSSIQGWYMLWCIAGMSNMEKSLWDFNACTYLFHHISFTFCISVLRLNIVTPTCIWKDLNLPVEFWFWCLIVVESSRDLCKLALIHITC